MSLSIVKKLKASGLFGGTRSKESARAETRTLPAEIWQHIASFLSIRDLKTFSSTCWFLRGCSLHSLLRTITINSRVDPKQPFHRMGRRVAPEFLQYIQELHYTYKMPKGAPLKGSFVSLAFEFYNSFNHLRHYLEMHNLHAMHIYLVTIFAYSQRAILSHPGLSTLGLHNATWKPCQIKPSLPHNITSLILTGYTEIHEGVISVLAPKLKFLECQFDYNGDSTLLTVFNGNYPLLESFIFVWAHGFQTKHVPITTAFRSLLARTPTIRKLSLYNCAHPRMALSIDSLPLLPRLEAFSATVFSMTSLVENRQTLKSLHLVDKYQHENNPFNLDVHFSQLLSAQNFHNLEELCITTYHSFGKDLITQINTATQFLPNLETVKLVFANDFKRCKNKKYYPVKTLDGLFQALHLPWETPLAIQIKTLIIGHRNLRKPDEIVAANQLEILVVMTLAAMAPGLTDVRFLVIENQEYRALDTCSYDFHRCREREYLRFCMDDETMTWNPIRTS